MHMHNPLPIYILCFHMLLLLDWGRGDLVVADLVVAQSTYSGYGVWENAHIFCYLCALKSILVHSTITGLASGLVDSLKLFVNSLQSMNSDSVG